MRPPVWRPPVEPSSAEQSVIRLVRRAKLFVWLREHRHESFDDDLQGELAAAYQPGPKGQPPVPPAQLALATILQAYTGASDDEVVEACVMDRRWQVVLDCLDAERAPFSKGTLVGFRARLIAHGLDRRLVERTVALARAKGGFGDRALRAALDASPLWGLAGWRTPSTCWARSAQGVGRHRAAAGAGAAVEPGDPGAGGRGERCSAWRRQREGGVGP